jgi:hypothetical protein
MVQIGDIPSVTGSETATTTTAWPPPLEPCGSRLPCGLCLITNQMCPKYVEPMTIKWNEVTCK